VRDPLRLSFAIVAAVLVLWVDATTIWRVVTQGYAGDWVILWQGGRTASPYADLEALPFAYPPTAHHLLRLFAELPFFASLVLWSVAGTATLYCAGVRLAGSKFAALAALMPAWIVAALSGQVSLFVGALTIAGLTARVPFLAGLCFAAAGLIKPQALIALPIAFLASRDWRVAAWTGACGLTLVALSTALVGPQPWMHWIGALPSFQDILASRGIDTMGIGANALAIRFGIPLIYYAGVVLGLACAWSAFRRDNRLDRHAALICSAALISPYMLHYDLAALGVSATALMLDGQRTRLTVIGAALAISYVLAPVGIICLAIALLRSSRPVASAESNRVANSPS
jgi:hypothetical protein